MTTLPTVAPPSIEIDLKPGVHDSRGESVRARMASHLGLRCDRLRTRDVFTLAMDLSPEELERVRREFTDPVIQCSAAGRLEPAEPFDWMALIAFKPGVTDNVGRTAATAIADILGRPLAEGESAHTATAYFFSGGDLGREDVERVARDLLANELIQTIEIVDSAQWAEGHPAPHAPTVHAETGIAVARIDLCGDDDDLMRISREGTLSLSLAEMRAIRDYFTAAASSRARRAAGLDARPTDMELEMLAQTWSEHCKHKIFAGTIDYTDEHGGTQTIDSLFKTYIKAATSKVAEKIDWLVSVFVDDAGIVDFNERLNVCFKVETHNSPSALEPYGGAMTGIVGVNRDALAAGLGAELLANVWGYCFASPFTPSERVSEGTLHPRRLRDRVHDGVIDGGNQSGIPYATGWEFYDERYLAKPLVYCGTAGLLPKRLPDGRDAGRKRARPGDRIVMLGGRIGKDGIHGATFSSEELHKDSPVQAVQIGDPITQKKMADMLHEARDRGLYSALTDNGAGGLSSSVGEMARGSGGAAVDLAKAPLKYAGLQPWEIWVSEAQERMTLAVPPERVEELLALARRREVEATVLGEFTGDGWLRLTYGEETVGLVEMEFLHEGCPNMRMRAAWTPPRFEEPSLPAPRTDLTADVLGLLGRLNICSKEHVSRRYDHEVKGRTVVKPWVGVERDVPSDATVLLAEYGGREGIVLAYGMNPHLSDLDCYWMTAAVIDEAIRRILAVGGRLDRIAGLDNFCWPDPVESPTTPDGPYKLAQLVRANQALYDFCVAFGVPLISGKDSMKNDSTRGGRKISIPPSLLFSAIGKIDDVERALTLEAKAAGDIVVLIGQTRAELGGSEYAHMLADRLGPRADVNLPGAIGNSVPKLDAVTAMATYRIVEQAAREGLFRSLHALTLGGLAAGLARVAIGGRLGLDIGLGEIDGNPRLTDAEFLFSQSNGRFVATVDPGKSEELIGLLSVHNPHDIPVTMIGTVTEAPRLIVKDRHDVDVVDASLDELRAAWQAPLGSE